MVEPTPARNAAVRREVCNLLHVQRYHVFPACSPAFSAGQLQAWLGAYVEKVIENAHLGSGISVSAELLRQRATEERLLEEAFEYGAVLATESVMALAAEGSIKPETDCWKFVARWCPKRARETHSG
jgi:hypothetical protein